MKSFFVLCAALCLIVSGNVRAQTPTLPPATPVAPASNPAADQAWAAVVALQRAAQTPAAAAPGLSVAAAAVGQKETRAQAARQVAAAAKDFYTRFPAHAQAVTARKTEALSALAGITETEPAYEAAALKTAGDFRVNQTHPVADRFEVAHAVERHTVSRKLGGKHWLSAPFESEALADRLRSEFGHFPGVYGNYLNVAEHTTCDHSRDMARRILQMPAPAHVKVAAQRVLDRALLMRKPLDFPLTTSEGTATRLAAIAGSGAGARTVVVFWDGTRSPAGPPGLHPYIKTPNTKWVYISMGAWNKPEGMTGGDSAGKAVGKAGLATTKSSVAPPGTYCVEALGLQSPLFEQLKLSQLPFVCVLDEKKTLNAFGRISEIPALLAGINRMVEP